MPPKPVPARLHVLLAREAPYGVVIRRGPSKQTAVIGWDRTRDTFTLGQWVKSRIYERQCDLSPDGRHLITFILDGRWQSESQGAYTAISIAPFLKAISLYPEGSTWQGGGLWSSNSTAWISGASDRPVRESPSIKRVRQPSTRLVGGENIYYSRLVRDGWMIVDLTRGGGLLDFIQSLPKARRWTGHDLFERPVGHGWMLEKVLTHNTEHHRLIRGEELLPLPDWSWADVDRDRVVYASGGCLWAVRIEPNGLGEAQMLFNFNPMMFEAIQAPY